MNVNDEIAVLLLGSNLGDRISFLKRSVELIEHNCGKVFKRSSFYETAPWGYQQQPFFINQCVLLKSRLEPSELLNELLIIETTLGRAKSGKWQPRLIDIDILFFGNRVVNETNLIIPHPMIAERNFTLIPLLEVMPDFKHPVFNKHISELLAECTDSCVVKIVNPSETLHA